MSKKAKKAAAAAREAAAAVPPPPPAAPPKPPGKKALLIAAKKSGTKKSSRLPVTREKPEDRNEAPGPTVPQPDERPRSFLGRIMTAQIAPKYKPAIGRDPGALVG